ncbi:MAG: hypothetical protein ABEL51_05015 [Salinibacter sp.]
MAAASASPWQADTLFGHLCWQVVRRDGESALDDLLTRCREGEPPVLLSDGFPAGFLPRPRLGLASTASEAPSKADRVRQYREVKDLQASAWLDEASFGRVLQGEFVRPDTQPEVATRVVNKNQIDRLTHTAGSEGGQLFDFTEHCWSAVDVYWRLAEGWADLVKRFLDDLAVTGYGKRKSVGYGAIDDVEFAPFDGFPPIDDADGFVSLSRFVPSPDDPTDGRWSTQVKYGKLGEEAAFSDQPFKKPLIQLVAGSCFRDRPVRPWYGRLVENIAADPSVIQYGFALPIPLRWPEGRR